MGKAAPVFKAIFVTVASLAVWEFLVKPELQKLRDQS